MKIKAHDYWKPQPGSWEEVVDPYDVQLSRMTQAPDKQKQAEIPVKMLGDRKTPPPPLSTAL